LFVHSMVALAWRCRLAFSDLERSYIRKLNIGIILLTYGYHGLYRSCLLVVQESECIVQQGNVERILGNNLSKSVGRNSFAQIAIALTCTKCNHGLMYIGSQGLPQVRPV
jgi:hypothetical protein